MSLALEKLFWSNCRKKLLEKFFLEHTFNPKKDFFIRELCRDIDEQINAVRRELENLEKLWILKSRWEDNTKHYSLNLTCNILPDLQMIFGKSFDAMGKLEEYFRGKHNLSLLVVGGGIEDMTRESTNNLIDILVIGDIDKDNFNLFLTKHFFGRKIKYAVISEKEFTERMKFGDKLITRILNQSGNVILKDSLGLKTLAK